VVRQHSDPSKRGLYYIFFPKNRKTCPHRNMKTGIEKSNLNNWESFLPAGARQWQATLKEISQPANQSPNDGKRFNKTHHYKTKSSKLCKNTLPCPTIDCDNRFYIYLYAETNIVLSQCTVPKILPSVQKFHRVIHLPPIVTLRSQKAEVDWKTMMRNTLMRSLTFGFTFRSLSTVLAGADRVLADSQNYCMN